MSDVGAVAKLFDTIANLWKNRPGRLQRQSIEAARRYIDINETGKRNGRVLTDKSKKKWLLHYKKQFISWMDGV